MFDKFLKRFKDILSLQRQNKITERPRRYKWMLIIGMLSIISWQMLFVLTVKQIPTKTEWTRNGTSGFSFSKAKHFVYFYHHKGLFPVATTLDTAFTAEDHNAATAERILNEEGHSLINEYQHWTRLGEHARIFLFTPGTWIYGTHKPILTPFNIMVLMAVLLFTYFMFWYYKRPWLGLILVFLVGSSPYILAETYRIQNIFALISLHGLFQLALFLPLFEGKFKWKYLLIPLISGLAIGTVIHVRGEMLPILVSCLLLPFFNRGISWVQKGALTVVLLGSYYVTNKAWNSYFDAKWDEAIELVEEKGGTPYVYPRTAGHMFWHPVFCGLGDYGGDKGYVWHDTVAYTYALPILEERLGRDLAYSGKYHLDEYYDENQRYYKKFDEIPEYEEIMKEKVMSDIKTYPGWYAGILMKRVGTFFNNTSPVHINIANHRAWIPWNGWFVLPILILLWLVRARFELKLIVFTMPIAASSIIIYSGGNSTFVSVYHLVALALLVAWLIEDYLRWKQGRREPLLVNPPKETAPNPT